MSEDDDDDVADASLGVDRLSEFEASGLFNPSMVGEPFSSPVPFIIDELLLLLLGLVVVVVPSDFDVVEDFVDDDDVEAAAAAVLASAIEFLTSLEDDSPSLGLAPL